MGILDSLKSGKYHAVSDSSKNVNIKLGDGNSNITVNGSNVDITTGTGNQTVVVLGNDVDIKLDQDASPDWDFEEVNDRDNVVVIGDEGHINIDTGDGNDFVFSVGDDNHIKTGDGNQRIIFNGNDVTVDAGDGNHGIYTLDFALTKGLDNGVANAFSE